MLSMGGSSKAVNVSIQGVNGQPLMCPHANRPITSEEIADKQTSIYSLPLNPFDLRTTNGVPHGQRGHPVVKKRVTHYTIEDTEGNQFLTHAVARNI